MSSLRSGLAQLGNRTNKDLTSRVFEPMFKSFVQEARGDDRGSGLCGLTKLTWFLLSLVDSATAASCRDIPALRGFVVGGMAWKRWEVGDVIGLRLGELSQLPDGAEVAVVGSFRFASKVQIVAHPLVKFLTKEFGCGPGRWFSFTIRHV